MHLVLDLDETLVHVRPARPETTTGIFIVRVEGITYYGVKRPGLSVFLKYAFDNFESVSVWTAASRDYAIQVLHAILTPEQQARLSILWTREHLDIRGDGSFFKPLMKMFQSPRALARGMTIRNTIMIDDRADVMEYNPGNGIVIPAFNPGKRHPDTWLSKLVIVLEGMRRIGVKPTDFTEHIYLKEVTREK